MQAEVRQKRIEEYLQKVEFASLDELAREVDASISTVRRDLDSLETGGNIARTHGGARLIAPRTDEYVFARRETVQLAEKDAIGALCASLIAPGQTVIVDAGTTAYAAARHLEGNLHVITNSLPVANHFASSASVEVVVSGGIIYPRLGVLVGPLAVETFSKTHADVAIMSGGGVTLDGVTNSHALLIDIQRAMLSVAARVIFCFDHTKLGRRSVAHLCELSRVATIVTDAKAPPGLLQEFRDRGVEILIAGQSDDPAELVAMVEAHEPVAAPPQPEESGRSRMSWD